MDVAATIICVVLPQSERYGLRNEYSIRNSILATTFPPRVGGDWSFCLSSIPEVVAA